MKRFYLHFFFWIVLSSPCFAQQDSVDVFFIGNTTGEKFKIFWDGKLILTFKGSKSYKYNFKVPREEAWVNKRYTGKFLVYRKSAFGLSYKEIGAFNPGYEPHKYLVIWRNPRLKKQ